MTSSCCGPDDAPPPPIAWISHPRSANAVLARRHEMKRGIPWNEGVRIAIDDFCVDRKFSRFPPAVADVQPTVSHHHMQVAKAIVSEHAAIEKIRVNVLAAHSLDKYFAVIQF